MIVICTVSESLSTILKGGRAGRRSNSPASVERVKHDLLTPGGEVDPVTAAPGTTVAFSEFFGPL